MTRALPLFCIALQREIAACSAAARPNDVLSAHTLMTIGEPQQLGQCSAHNHFARVHRKSARIEQGAVLIHDRLYFSQISVRSKDNLDKRAQVAVRCLYLPLWAMPFRARPPEEFLEIRETPLHFRERGAT